MDELKEQICEILFKRSEYTRISEINGLHQLHERQFDNVSEDILSLLEQRQETRPHETIVMWRSVEEQLPEEHEDVLVYYYGNRDSKFCRECRYIKQSCYYDGEFECEEEVTHWAKIPDPPQYI